MEALLPALRLCLTCPSPSCAMGLTCLLPAEIGCSKDTPFLCLLPFHTWICCWWCQGAARSGWARSGVGGKPLGGASAPRGQSLFLSVTSCWKVSSPPGCGSDCGFQAVDLGLPRRGRLQVTSWEEKHLFVLPAYGGGTAHGLGHIKRHVAQIDGAGDSR